jgi:hypothetical protein
MSDKGGEFTLAVKTSTDIRCCVVRVSLLRFECALCALVLFAFNQDGNGILLPSTVYEQN